MKSHLLPTTIACLLSMSAFAQSTTNDTIYVNIISDISSAESTGNQNSNAVSTGRLGINFKNRNIYGAALFSVINNDFEPSTIDSAEVAVFSSNLLIPNNSGKGLSNFRLDLGFSSFAGPDVNLETLPLFSPHKIGIHGFWQVNKTLWTDQNTTIPLFISSFGIAGTYDLLTMELFNKDKEDVKISLEYGFESRRLGGDYSLDKNDSLRVAFLGTSDIAFDAWKVGAKLELGKFYAKGGIVAFGQKNQIEGFSGYQAIIELGAQIELNVGASAGSTNKIIAAKVENKTNRTTKKELRRQEKNK